MIIQNQMVHQEKVLDIAKINDLGWFAKTELKSGLSISFDWFKENYKTLRK